MSKDDYQAREAQRRADQDRHDAANRMWQQRDAERSARLAAERQQTGEARGRTGGGGCFPKGTGIATPFGPRDVSELREGDFVVAMSRRNGERRARKILKKIIHADRKIWRLEFSDGSSLRTTAAHSFSVGGKSKKASEIGPGDSLAAYDGSGGFSEKTVTCSLATGEREDVYNLIVEGDFNFVAGGVVAHSFTYFKTVRGLAWSLVESSRGLPGKVKIALKPAGKSGI